MDQFAVFWSVLIALVFFCVGFFLRYRQLFDIRQQLGQHLERANQAEKYIHIKEMEFIDEKNKNNVEHSDALNHARAMSFEDGRRHERANAELELSKKISDQRKELEERFRNEKEAEIKEFSDRIRAEYELRTKIFSIVVSPYLFKSDISGFFSSKAEVRVGYQYQLFVNGVPAFSPHVIVERSEMCEKYDEDVRRKFLDVAFSMAQVVVETYLGRGGGLLGPAVIKEVGKK